MVALGQKSGQKSSQRSQIGKAVGQKSKVRDQRYGRKLSQMSQVEAALGKRSMSEIRGLKSVQKLSQKLQIGGFRSKVQFKGKSIGKQSSRASKRLPASYSVKI